MQANLQTLGALERRIDLTVPATEIEKEVATRLSKLARTVRMPGFRQGKVPLKMVAQQLRGPGALRGDRTTRWAARFNDAVTRAEAARGRRHRGIEPRDGGRRQGSASSPAMFEVYPEIKVGDLANIEVQRAVCEVGDAQIDSTIEIMRRQRATYEAVECAAADGDRVTVDFVGSDRRRRRSTAGRPKDFAVRAGRRTDAAGVRGRGARAWRPASPRRFR
ncbi:MAG: trigger factor [Burkholderiaceae bacterium]|nr:trigger factor [Burkholderiaceae bacterium]